MGLTPPVPPLLRPLPVHGDGVARSSPVFKSPGSCGKDFSGTPPELPLPEPPFSLYPPSPSSKELVLLCPLSHVIGAGKNP